MSNREQYELEYLRVLTQKYGRYLKKYFGFTLLEMAQKLGIGKGNFSYMIQGHIPMPDKYRDSFVALFKEMKIEERTKDFKENKEQLWWREFWAKGRNHLTKCIFFYIIMTMMLNASFYLNTEKNFRQYIVGLWNNLAQKSHISLYRAITVLVVAFCVFLTKITQNLNIRRTRYRDAFFCF